jgi:hypothetical protein
MAAAWGLEIDKGRMALCRTRQTTRGLQVQRGAMAALPAGLIVPSLIDPNVTDGEALTGELRTLMKKAGCRGGAVAVALPDLTCRLGWQDFEEVGGTPSETLDLLRWRLKDRLPFPIPESRIDYQPLPSRAGKAQLFYVAAREAVLGQYETLILAAGLEPVRVIPRGIALYRIYWAAAGTGRHLVIATGPSSVSLVFAEEGIPRLWRVLPWDDRHTASLRHAQADDQDRTAEDRTAPWERLLRELQASLRYLGEELGSDPPDALVLMDGGDTALANALTRASQLPVSTTAKSQNELPADFVVPAGATAPRPAWRMGWKSR